MTGELPRWYRPPYGVLTPGAVRAGGGVAVTTVGLAAMVPNPVSLAAAGTLVAALQLQVRAVEEPYLARVHGEAWSAYAARVGRFLPGLGRQLHRSNP